MSRQHRSSGRLVLSQPTLWLSATASSTNKSDSNHDIPSWSSRTAARIGGQPRNDITLHVTPHTERRQPYPDRDHGKPVQDGTTCITGDSAWGVLHVLSTAPQLSPAIPKDDVIGSSIPGQRKRTEKRSNNTESASNLAHKKRKRRPRDVSGALLEEGRGERHDKKPSHLIVEDQEERVKLQRERRGSRKRGRLWYWIAAIILILAIVTIPLGVYMSNKKKGDGVGANSRNIANTDSGKDAPLNSCKGEDIPADSRGTYTDTSVWIDTRDFNCTYTAELVGNLSTMGLYTTWDDTARANDKVPALNESWEYGKRPIRGISVGGWFVIEPFITPSLFDYPASAKVVDEYSLTQKLSERTNSSGG